MSLSSRFLISNGVVFQPYHQTPPLSTFLETHSGAYTTTRTQNNGTSLLFWERHLKRLTNSARILFGSSKLTDPFEVKSLVNVSTRTILPIALREMREEEGEELAVTALLTGGGINGGFGVHVHVGAYAPHAFGASGGGARLAMVGPGRDLPQAKYSDWVRLRKPLELLRPPSVTELLLSNDGDRVLEGCVTNFFVVVEKENDEAMKGNPDNFSNSCPFEVQTTPIGDGILPGVIRQLIIEVCSSKQFPVKEVSPLWSNRECWREAFITNSLRIVQHVENVQVPCSWDLLQKKNLDDIEWEEQHFQNAPGPITSMIQREIMEKAVLEGFTF